MSEYSSKELFEWAKANRVKSKLNEATNDWASRMTKDGNEIVATAKHLMESVHALREMVEGMKP